MRFYTLKLFNLIFLIFNLISFNGGMEGDRDGGKEGDRGLTQERRIRTIIRINPCILNFDHPCTVALVFQNRRILHPWGGMFFPQHSRGGRTLWGVREGAQCRPTRHTPGARALVESRVAKSFGYLLLHLSWNTNMCARSQAHIQSRTPFVSQQQGAGHS